MLSEPPRAGTDGLEDEIPCGSRASRTGELSGTLSPELLHERVKGEWSFIETVRHLLFVTDA